MPSFYPTRRPPSYDAPPPRGADYAPPPRRSFSPTTRPVPVAEVTTTELTNELNEAEKIKSMLKSGAVGNDPRKIKEMLMKMKKAKTAGSKGGFQLDFVSISLVINQMTCYEFECSHWWKIYFKKILYKISSPV